MPVVLALYPPSLNLDCLHHISEKRDKEGNHLGGHEMFFSLYFCVSSWSFFFISLDSSFPLDVWVGLWQRAGRAEPNSCSLHSLHILDSTRKVSDVLKLFEDGEMAEYLQGDVSGSWEILSFTNSSHLCFCYSIGMPNFQGLFWAQPLLSSLPSIHCYCNYCFRTKQEILVTQDLAQ